MTRQEQKISNPTHQPDEMASEAQIQKLLFETMPYGSGLTTLPGFRLNLSANQDFHKVFFSAGCDCGTNALLSVEVSKKKTLSEIELNLPTLIEKLTKQAQMFRNMSCNMHTTMRMGVIPEKHKER